MRVGRCSCDFQRRWAFRMNAIGGAYAENLPVILVSGAPNTNDRATEHLIHHTLATHDLSYQLEIAKRLTAAAVAINHVNMAQSSNDTFPSAMNVAAVNVKQRLIPAVKTSYDAIAAKVGGWNDIVKIGRMHMQDATPLTLGQEWSGYAGVLADDLERIEDGLKGVYRLALGGTAVGTGINSAPGFGEAATAEIAKLTDLPFVSAPNKFTVQGAHDALVQLSGTMRTLAVSLYKIANDIRLMSCGPRAGFAELLIPENEPGSSIMPGKVNPTQAEALTMIAVQVMANDVAVGFGGAGGYLEMNVYKPLIIFNVTHSITIMADGSTNFRRFLVDGAKPNLKKINEYVERSLMLVMALSPVIGYDKASKIAHYAMDNDLTLKAAALKLGFVTGLGWLVGRLGALDHGGVRRIAMADRFAQTTGRPALVHVVNARRKVRLVCKVRKA